MSNEWKSLSISEVAEIIGGGTPKTKNAEYWNGDIPWLSVVDFNNDLRFVESTEKKITSSGLANSSTKLLSKGDLIISARGTVGALAQLIKPMTFNQSCYGIKAKEIVDSGFLYYAIKNIISTVKMNTHGSVFDTITKDTFNHLFIPVPSIEEQRKIADVLTVLDKKIHSNVKQTKVLEEMAQAIFKNWFVDFGPFKDGEFVDSELGMIPKGWEVKKLGDFFPVITGKKNANVSSKKGNYPFFSCSQDFAWTDNYSFDGSAILVAGNGDFNVKWYEGKFEAYQRTYVLIPFDERLTGLLFYMISYFLTTITSGHRGSVIKFITKGSIEDYKVSVPNDLSNYSVIDTFRSLIKLIDHHKNEIRILSSLRDSLLPKLMSGEIRVPRKEV